MERLSDSASYYDLLGIQRTATEQEVNKAYKKLAVKYHPDKNPGEKELAEENFKKVCEAYEVLSNKEKRQTYDQFGKQGLNQSGGGGGFARGQADEIFAQFFGGQDPFSARDRRAVEAHRAASRRSPRAAAHHRRCYSVRWGRARWAARVCNSPLAAWAAGPAAAAAAAACRPAWAACRRALRR